MYKIINKKICISDLCVMCDKYKTQKKDCEETSGNGFFFFFGKSSAAWHLGIMFGTRNVNFLFYQEKFHVVEQKKKKILI